MRIATYAAAALLTLTLMMGLVGCNRNVSEDDGGSTSTTPSATSSTTASTTTQNTTVPTTTGDGSLMQDIGEMITGSTT